MRIPLSAPEVTEADIEAVASVLRTPRLSIGPRMEEFERAVAGYAGVRHGVAVSSGTAGLHLCLRALDIGENDEIILPSFTFIAVAHAVRYERAIPVFADIDPLTLNVTAGTIERRITPRTRAIIVVHTFGYPADMASILEMAGRHRLPVIEDACEALGAESSCRKTGGIGRLGVFAFYPNKPITTAEGGMVVTDDDALAEMLRALRNQGRKETGGWTDHALLGYNYRLSELQCALGLSQMGRLEQVIDRRRDRALRYLDHLVNLPEVIPPRNDVPGSRVCWFAFVVRLASDFTQADRDFIHRRMIELGIGCERYFAPIHRQPLYAAFAPEDHAALPFTEEVSARTLALPFFNALADHQVVEVCEALRQSIGLARRSHSASAGRSI